MFRWLFKWFKPRGPLDILGKIALVLSAVIGTHIGFALVYLGHLPVGFDYFVAHAVFVGVPWLSVFFVVSRRQDIAQRRLEELSRIDDLTGMLNRRSFLYRFERFLAAGHPGVLLMLDADHFKAINDEYGHVAGDDCLRHISSVLQDGLRKRDIIGRLGGEEFAILLPRTTRAEARAIADRFTAPITIPATNVHPAFDVTLSVGATSIRDDLPVAKLMARADRGLYAAKDAGRACLRFWEDLEQGDRPDLAISA